MLKLIEVNEQNWLDIANLTINEKRKSVFDDTIGIFGGGYVHRTHRARVIGIVNDDMLAGVALVKDKNEGGACCDLIKFMIDRRYQGKGIATEALRMILRKLEEEWNYDCVKVCVKKDDIAMLRFYEMAGFIDTGCMDEETKENLNLMYHYSKNLAVYSDTLIADFSNPLFQMAFREYFGELNIAVQDWDRLFQEMNEE